MPDFDFQKHCLFCRETCNVNKDLKHPACWRWAYLCRTVMNMRILSKRFLKCAKLVVISGLKKYVF